MHIKENIIHHFPHRKHDYNHNPKPTSNIFTLFLVTPMNIKAIIIKTQLSPWTLYIFVGVALFPARQVLTAEALKKERWII